MSDHSLANNSDTFSTRVTYAVAQEFIYRLSAYLEHEHETKSRDGSIPSETLIAVETCAQAAHAMISDLESGLTAPTDSRGCHGDLGIGATEISEDAATIIAGTVGVVNRIKQADPMTAFESRGKARLLVTFAKEFFSSFGMFCRRLYWEADDSLPNWYVEMVRGCIFAASEVLHALQKVTWAEGAAVPVEAINPVRDLAISYRLQGADPGVVDLTEVLYAAMLKTTVEGV